MTLQERLAACGGRVTARLGDLLTDLPENTPSRLRAAMGHALLSGGKRFRPFLTIEAARLIGERNGADDGAYRTIEARALEAGVAVELLHTYSLVHDDMPAMDDDDLRRGRPTVHIAYDEATAILVGDALQALAFATLTTNRVHPDPAVRVRLLEGLALAAGPAGMVGGQMRDLEAEAVAGASEDGVRLIQTMKTGALIRFAAEAGAIVAGANDDELAALSLYADRLGFAFQIADDLLDVEGTPDAVGKSTGKDGAAGKATFVSLLGVEGARARLRALEREAVAALAPFADRGACLATAARFVVERRY